VSNDFKSISTSLIKGLLLRIGFMAVVVAGSHYIAALFEKPITVMIKKDGKE